MTTPSGTPQPDQYGQQPQAQPGQYGQPTQPGQPPQPGQPSQPGQYTQQAGQGAQYGQPAQYAQSAPYGSSSSGSAAGSRSFRPGTVTGGAVLAWIGAAFMIIVGLLLMFAQALDPADLGLSADEGVVLQFIAIFGVVAAVWGVLVLVMAIFAFRGANWARWVLVVFGVLAVAGSLFNLFDGNALALISIIWVGLSVGLFLAPKSRDWYNARKSSQFNPGNYTR